MRIVVTGRDGQVARSLAERAAGTEGVEVVPLARPELDLAQPDTVRRAIAAARPDLVVSAAAYTAVDRAEDEPELAFAINRDGAGAAATAAADLGVPILHLSTDYVFDGRSDRPYREDDPTAPQGVYGASKLAGERAVAAANPQHFIFRTAWVYSPFGANFVKTMLRLAADRDEISVVADQRGNPTSALDIADALLHVGARLATAGPPEPGLYHLAGTGEASWSEFARHVLETSGAAGGPHARVKDITTADYPTKARRPANSRLSTARLETAFGWCAPEWRESSTATVIRLLG